MHYPFDASDDLSAWPISIPSFLLHGSVSVFPCASEGPKTVWHGRSITRRKKRRQSRKRPLACIDMDLRCSNQRDVLPIHRSRSPSGIIFACCGMPFSTCTCRPGVVPKVTPFMPYAGFRRKWRLNFQALRNTQYLAC